MKHIYFDMDGTIANLYGIEGWLDDIRAERVRPYAKAKPMVNMSALARILNRLTRNGYSVSVISWTAKDGSDWYNEAVAEAKRKWLKTHLASVRFDSVIIVPYGTRKSMFGHGVLFDDEAHNRDEWNGVAYDEKNIMKILKGME